MPEQTTLKESLTDYIIKYLATHSACTEDEVRKLFNVIGPNWINLAKACELRNKGYEFKYIFDKAAFGEL